MISAIMKYNVVKLTAILCVTGTALATFPTCVEVVDVVPRPFSKVSRKSFRFIAFFSKPVTRLNPGSDVFVTPSLLDVKEHRPNYSGLHGSSSQQYYFSFSLTESESRVFREIYLVIDGGSFAAREWQFSSGYWTPYVPLSIFGPYKFEGSYSRSPKPIVPSPYCYPRENRFYHRIRMSTRRKNKVTVAVKNYLVKTGKEFQLELSVNTCSYCEGVVKLPSVITALYKKRKVSVLIPSNTPVTVKSHLKEYIVPVYSRVVHEVLERIYHSRDPGSIQLTGRHSFEVPQKYMRKKSFGDKSVYYQNEETNVIVFRTQRKGGDYRNPNIITYAYSSSFRKRNKGMPRPYNPVWHKCSSNSTRSAGSGQQGPLYHSLEWGPFYLMLKPSLSRVEKWGSTVGTIQVKVKNKDVSKGVYFSKYRYAKTRIPLFIRRILKDYVILVPPVGDASRKVVIRPSLADAIFVPTSKVHNKCGGIYLYKNLQMLRSDKDFCNKPFGHCVGLPFSSRRRFPDIPPFDVRALSLTKNLKHLTIKSTAWIPIVIRRIPINNVKVLLPSFDSLSCDKIWKMNHSLSTDTKLFLGLTNSGEGGAEITTRVKCTASLDVLPLSGVKNQWIGPHKISSISYQLDASRVKAEGRRPHKCSMNLTIYQPTQNTTTKTVMCSRIITTYSGQFQNPCAVNEAPLPEFSLKYFVLPSSQTASTASVLHAFLRSEVGRELVFMKAITVTLSVSESQEHLLSNFNLLHVKCRKEAVVLLEEEELLNIATKTGVKHGRELHNPTLNYYSSFNKNRRIYYFAKRSWLSRISSDDGRKKPSSGCVIELFANRPSRNCYEQSLRVKGLIVPLVKSDVSELVKELKGDYWYLVTVFGEQDEEIMQTLLGCLVLSVFMLGITTVSHSLLFVYRKKLPNKDHLWTIENQLTKAKRKDKKRWENHQMYLDEGPYGTYYVLYDFKCTHSLSDLDSETIKTMRVAGLLRYGNKEQQILFGHVKKLFVSRKYGSGDILLQASSGMYLLRPKNVNEDYSEELAMFYEKRKIVVKEEEE